MPCFSRPKSHVEPVPETYEEIKARLLAKNALYEDPEFPCEMTIICGPETGTCLGGTVSPARSVYKWKRPTETHRQPEFIASGFSRFDINQGKIGDCWFLAAAACVAGNETRMQKVVPMEQSFQHDYCGLFRFNFFRFGEWKEVLVDDRLPYTSDDEPFYSTTSHVNEFWLPLLEKAFAKFHGSYNGIHGGPPHVGLLMLTGGVCEDVHLHINRNVQLFDTMRWLINNGGLIEVALMNPYSKSVLLPEKHAYSVTGVETVTLMNGKREELVRVRNPWGNRNPVEWNGKWNDRSNAWHSVSATERARLNLKIRYDGECWMPMKELMKRFDLITLCHLDIIGEQKITRMKATWRSRPVLILLSILPSHPPASSKNSTSQEASILLSLMTNHPHLAEFNYPEMKLRIQNYEQNTKGANVDDVPWSDITPHNHAGFGGSGMWIRKAEEFDCVRRVDVRKGRVYLLTVDYPGKVHKEMEFMLSVHASCPIDLSFL